MKRPSTAIRVSACTRLEDALVGTVFPTRGSPKLAPFVPIQNRLLGRCAGLRRAGRSILLVEENAMRAAAIADQVHLLDHGTLAWSGTGAELSGRPELLETYLGA